MPAEHFYVIASGEVDVIDEGRLVPHTEVEWLLGEADELTAMFTSARRSASQPPQKSNVKRQTS